MPQWRKLHTKITESLDVAEMPDDFTRLLWVLLPTQLCRKGRGVDNPSWVRARVFPLREDVTLAMVSAAMDWYGSRGMIVRYQVAGRSYFYVPTFARYQGNTDREAESEYPAPPDQVCDESRPTHDLLMSKSCSDVDADADVDSDSDAAAEAEADAPAAPATAAAEPRMGPIGYGRALADHGIIVNGSVQADMWRELYEEAGAELFVASLDEAVRASPRVPAFRYVQTIVKRCLADGTMPGARSRPQARASPLAGIDAAIDQVLREGG